MIYVGLTGWGDHDSIYTDLTNKNDKLKKYASYFPLVEVDSTYYAIVRQSTIQKWCSETPDSFKFIVKTHRFMTGHGDFRENYKSIRDVFNEFKEMLAPMVACGKLAYILMQFPPWYELNERNIKYIRMAKEMLAPLKVAIEFRNETWYQEEYKEQTIEFLHSEGLIHTIVDEPQAGVGSVPFVNRISDETAFIRLHGRNVHGWTQKDRTSEEWRDVRYLYDYNKSELEWLEKQVQILKYKSKDVFIIFNNNSGGHAASNALEFIDALEIEYQDLAPKQLKLF